MALHEAGIVFERDAARICLPMTGADVAGSDTCAAVSGDWPRTLVILGGIPGEDGVGAILERQILDVVPRDRIRIIAAVTRDVMAQHVAGHPRVDVLLPRRYEYAYHPLPGYVGEVFTHAANLATFRPCLRRLVGRCVDEGRAFGCEAVFAVLENPTTIFLAAAVARRLGVPLRSFVMDGPNLHARDYSYDRFTARALRRAFDAAMRRSDRIGVAGETMRDAYQRRYGKPAFILRQGLPAVIAEHSVAAPVPAKVDSRVLHIGFAGSLTAVDAFEQLLQELGRRAWRVGGRRVVLRVVGAYIKLVPHGPQHIEYYGWQSVPDMLALMRECDFLYLPQPFGEELREFSELSFPNKLCTYVPARRPLLLHAPPHASLHAFFREYPCGPVSDTLDAGKLLDQLESTLRDGTRLDAYVESIDKAHRERLNDSALAHAVRQLLSTGAVASVAHAA